MSSHPPRPSRMPFGRQANARQSFPRAPSTTKPTPSKDLALQESADATATIATSQLPPPSKSNLNYSGKSVRFGEFVDKENNGRAKAPTRNTGSLLRKSKGAAQSTHQSVSPQPISAPTAGAPVSCSATPARPSVSGKSPVLTPFPVVPTPISLLKSEMDITVGEVRSAAEESLLCSPAPVQASQRVRFLDVKAAGKSPAAALLWREKHYTPHGTREGLSSTPGAKGPPVSTLGIREPFGIAANVPKGTLTKKNLSVTIPPLPSIHGAGDRNQLIQHIQYSHTNESPTAASTPGGICLDLTDMFCNVASVSGEQSQYSVPPSTSRPWKRPPLQSSQQRKDVVAATAIPTENNSTAIPTTSESEEWIEKQCETFTLWLNYVVRSPAAHEESDASPPSALRVLQAHQHMANLRLKGLQLFERMRGTRQVLLREIQRGRLALRKDQNIFANLTLRQQMIELLLQYSTPWLRLGLETLFGQAILPDQPHHTASPPPETRRESRQQNLSTAPPASKSGPQRQALKRFIVQRVLSDEATLAKYTKGKCAVPSGKFEEQYQAELRSLVLFRLMVLFSFLDAAKMEHLIPDVTLFSRQSSLKSSMDVLLAFCRDFLSSEGNLIKHLARVGLTVSYQQDRLDEVDFNVTNLASDLRDGVRLTKVIEVLTKAPTKSLLSKLRVPATSRLQKLYNVGVALDQAQQTFGPLDGGLALAPHHIVDGHREMVVKLLWWLVAQSSLDQLVSLDQLQTETERLERLYKTTPLVDCLGRVDEEYAPKQHEKLKNFLLRWCRAVVGTFGVEISNLTTDFADGKALCYLISFYHPLLLRKRHVKRTTRDLPRSASNHERSQALLRERSNALLANSRLGDLGGIPKMVPICDSTCAPDERSILLCVSFMWSRLMESKGQIRSSVIIQSCYRKHRTRILMQRKRAAATTILRMWRLHKNLYYVARALHYGSAVRVIETFVQNRWSRLLELRENRIGRQHRYCAAASIQKYARRALCKIRYSEELAKTKAVVLFQSRWRCITTQRNFQSQRRRCHSCLVIQRAWRRYHGRISMMDIAATSIQRAWRGFLTMVQNNVVLMDIVVVQSVVRRFLAIRKRRQLKHAVMRIQRHLSSLQTQVIARRHRKQMVASILCQRVIRRMLAKTFFQKIKRARAATRAQTAWRRYVKQKLFRRSKQAVILLQSLSRQWSQYRWFLRFCGATIQLQAAWRKVRARRMFRTAVQRLLLVQGLRREFARTRALWMTQSAIRLQSVTRRLLVQRKIQTMQLSASLMQAIYRGHLQRLRFLSCLEAVVRIQSLFRKCLSLKTYLDIRRRVQQIQSLARFVIAKQVATSRRMSVVKIQSGVRRVLSAMVVRSKRHERLCCLNALVTIQRYWRGHQALWRFRSFMASIVVIQARIRKRNAHAEAQNRRASVVRLQTMARRKLAQNFVAQLRDSRHVELLYEANCVTTIQRSYRGHLVRREILCLHACALIIQRNFRCFMTWIRYQMDRVDVILVQTLVRKWKAEKSFLKKRQSVVCLQALWRGRVARILSNHLLVAQLQEKRQAFAAIELQRVFRGKSGRDKALREAAARLLQKTWRCFTVHVDYILNVLAAVKIQAKARSFLGRMLYLRFKRSCVKINSVSRGFLCRLDLKRNILAAHMVQKAYRGYSAKSDYLLLKSAAIIIQCAFRGHKTRVNVRRQIVFAIKIQRIWRGYQCFREFVWIIFAAIKIQSVVRKMLAASQVRRKRLAALSKRIYRARSSILIQRCFRSYIKWIRHVGAARTLQSVVRMFLCKQHATRAHQSIVICQSLARGWCVRRRRSISVSAQVRRVLRANSCAKLEPSKCLGNRTKDALCSLLRMRRLSELHAAICTLEVATRLSKECCQMFVNAGATHILFSLIRTCNRSLPHIQLLNNMLRTLWNVSRDGHFVATMATSMAVEVFLDLIQMFRDKDEIFYQSAKLLEVVLLFNSSLESICRTQENQRRLNGVLHVHLRKTPILGQHRLSTTRDSRAPLGRRNNNETSHLCHGIKTLERVILLVSSNNN